MKQMNYVELVLISGQVQTVEHSIQAMFKAVSFHTNNVIKVYFEEPLLGDVKPIEYMLMRHNELNANEFDQEKWRWLALVELEYKTYHLFQRWALSYQREEKSAAHAAKHNPVNLDQFI